MTVRLSCPACKAAFKTSDEALGRKVACPKCGATQVVPRTTPTTPSAAPAAPPLPARGGGPAAGPTVFVRNDAPKPSKSKRKVVMGLVGFLLIFSAIGLFVAWPYLRPRPAPPADAIVRAASGYLQALVKDDHEAAKKLGVVDLPPAIRSYRAVKRDRTRDATARGSFKPVAALHARIDRDYVYDSALGRYTPRNALGPAAEVLDALHDAKDKAQRDGLYKKMESGNPDDLFDAAEGLGKTMAKLSEGVLSPKKLLPTYAQLVAQAKPPLGPAESELARDFGKRGAAWEALLGRPFSTLRSDGPFVFDRAEVTAEISDRLASLGDPPTTLHLSLVRFRLEGIDTGWKVVAARRAGADPEPEPEPEPEPATASKPAPTPTPASSPSPGELPP